MIAARVPAVKPSVHRLAVLRREYKLVRTPCRFIKSHKAHFFLTLYLIYLILQHVRQLSEPNAFKPGCGLPRSSLREREWIEAVPHSRMVIYAKVLFGAFVHHEVFRVTASRHGHATANW